MSLASINRLVTAAETGGAGISAIASFAVMVIVFVDVGLRYIFNAPLPWSYDLIGMYLVPALFFPILSDTFRRNHHIALDILYLRFPGGWQRASRLLSALIGLVAFGLLAWRASLNTAAAMARGDVVGGSILWPTWVPLAIAALGFWLIVARLVLDAAALAFALAFGTEGVAGESPERGRQHDHAFEEI